MILKPESLAEAPETARPIATSAQAAPLEQVQSLAAKEKAPLLATLKDLVSIESGSGDREGLDRLSALIAERLGQTAEAA